MLFDFFQSRAMAAGNDKAARSQGDLISLFAIVNPILYFLVIVGQHYKFFDVVSPSFARDGFCVSNKDQGLYMQSHALCLYGDSFFTLLLGLLVFLDKSEGDAGKIVGYMKSMLPGLFGHGVAHMIVAHKFETATPEWMGMSPFARNEGLDVPKYWLFLTLFWYGFMRTSHPSDRKWLPSNAAIFFTLVYGCTHFFMVPGLFAFTYVNCMLQVHFAVNILFFDKETRDSKYYAAFVASSVLPTQLAAWSEAMACDLVRPLGGHLVYDLSIPISMLGLYSYVRYSEKGAAKQD